MDNKTITDEQIICAFSNGPLGSVVMIPTHQPHPPFLTNEQIVWAVRRFLAGSDHTAIERWIPVTERLPDDGESVMIAMKDASEPVWIGFHEGERWFSDDAVEQRVTHWMPIIEGPKG